MNRGFTLVELSIVLVIIGLVIAGVVFGREMVESYKISKVASEFIEYETAYNTFKLKYSGEIPGDTTRATVYFDNVQNGNGDGVVSSYERYHAMEHLGKAGLIDFSGEYVNASNVTPGSNIPSASYSERHSFIVSGYEIGGYANYASLQPGNHLAMRSTADTPAATLSALSFVGPSGPEAEQLDRKLDDGFPYSGRLRDNRHSSCTITADSVYRTTEAFGTYYKGSCTPHWRLDGF